MDGARTHHSEREDIFIFIYINKLTNKDKKSQNG